MFDPAPLPPQCLLGHWFLSRPLPHIFILDLLLPLDFVDEPQTGVEECQNLLLHRCVVRQPPGRVPPDEQAAGAPGGASLEGSVVVGSSAGSVVVGSSAWSVVVVVVLVAVLLVAVVAVLLVSVVAVLLVAVVVVVL